MKETKETILLGIGTIFGMEIIDKFLIVAPVVSYLMQWTIGAASLIYILIKIKNRLYEKQTNKKDA